MSSIDLIPPVTANAVRLYGSYTELREVSPNIFGYGYSDNPDWYAVSDSKSDVDERIGADGGFPVEHDWRSSLAVSIKGWYRGPDRSQVRLAQNVLKRAVAQGSMITLRHTDEDEVTERVLSVRRFTPSDTRGERYFTFVLDLLAPDPLLYGALVTLPPVGVPSSGGGLVFPLGTTPGAYWDFGPDGTSGRREITNNGTAEAFPDITVTGGLELGFLITDVTTGQQVIFMRPIPLGSTVTINQRTGQALLDGQNDVSGSVTSWDYFSIPPGETHVIQFSPLGTTTGTPQATFAIQPASH
jgi:hypothetical protein